MGLFDFFKKGREEPIHKTTPETAKVDIAPRLASKTHTVVSGESLSKIAKHYYGDATKWNVIYEANRETIKNPDLIHPGEVLKIPNEATSK